MTLAQPGPLYSGSLVLATPRLTLRPLQAADVEGLVAGLGDVAVSRMLARVPHPYRRSDAASFVAVAAAQNEAGSDLHLAVLLRGELIGGISLHGLPHIADFGYWIARPHWGRGYASEAAEAVLAHAFCVIGADHVPSGVFFDNPASLRVQRKLGFEQVGTSGKFSLARGEEVEHIDTVLRRARFEELRR